MKYVLFHDTDCAACSGIARTLQSFDELSSLTHTGIAGDDHPELRAQIAPEEFPVLVRLADGRRWSGARLTVKLGSMVAPRHWRQALQLLATSRRVRATRAGGVSRRSVLGGLAAGAVAAVVGVPATATAAPRATRVVDVATQQKMLRLAADRNAAWGTPTHVDHLSGATPMFVVYHSDTHVSMIPESEQSFVLGMSIDARAHQIAYYLPGSATASAIVTAVDGKVSVRAGVPPHPTRGGAETESIKNKLICFAKCAGQEAVEDPGCYFTCASGAVIPCALCAGPKGLSCALKCRRA